MPNRIQKRVSRRVLLLALLVSAALNVLLTARAAKERHALESARAQVSAPVGYFVPEFSASDVAGRHRTVTFDDGRTTIFYLTAPGCSWCERNSEAFSDLVFQLDDRYRIVRITSAEPKVAETVSPPESEELVLSSIGAYAREAYRFGATPQTIVVSDTGRVIEHWRGAYTGHQKQEVEDFFHVRLPEIPDA